MAPVLLVATVAECTLGALRQARDDAARHADLVELRLDALREAIDVDGALEDRTAPVVVTCRPKREGGLFEGSEEERVDVLRKAIAAGAEYVDLEWRSPAAELASMRGGRGVVLSMHDFKGVPADLDAQLRAMLAVGTEVVKIAVTASCLGDCTRLARLAGTAQGRTLAFVAMGAAGISTRLLPSRFGSSWTYAGKAAPGQINAELMVGRYRVRSVRESTAVYGVAGRPVVNSLSPAMHNACFAAAGIDAVYIPLDTASADDLFAFAEWLPLAGMSVTAPLKREVFNRVDRCDETAQRVGAVNTLGRACDGWTAINTDVEGFRAPLAARGLRLAGTRAAILGAGGAARAAAVALAGDGAQVSVHARRLDDAREVARLASGTADDRWPEAGTWQLLVNATPAGWESEPQLIGPACAGACVYDMVSTPAETPLLARAAAAGCRTVSGLEMLVAQGEAQATWWTGKRPPAGLMRRAAEHALAAPPGKTGGARP